ncbi:MAG: ATP-binding protein, partial [Spirochaetota bacterium]
ERSEAETELGKAREAAEAEALAQGSLVANVSHEIRTPLNAILGFSELISERSSDPQTQDYLRAIKTAGGSLLSLVNNLLDLGRMEAKNFELHPEPMELGRLLDELGAVFGIRLKEKGLAFELAKGPGLPGALLLDSARLRQILYNLIGNAVKYTERGSVKVEARAGPAKAGKVGLSVSVRDTGIGVSEEAAKALSSDFSHLSGGSMYKSGGLGLGLTISRRLATLMGGHLEFETSIGKGSTFTLVLPEVEVAEAPWLPPVTGLAARRFLPADILLVEDARFNRMVVVDFLKNSGLTVHEAENGLQGLELTRSLGPSLILLDMKMPVMDGAEMLEHLRADPLTRDIPVIAMTAGSIEADEDPGQVRVACDAYLGKPHTRAELLLVLERFLPSEERKALDLPPAGSEPPEALTIGRFFPGARLGALMTEWRKVAELSSIDDIELFAKRILREASRGGDAAAVSWAESLIEACSSFDLLLMERLFGDFPRLAGASDEGLG